jgi:colanic acid biosynthesis glycosyl transferase WcaI
MKILFLTQWFHPEPHFKGLPLAKALRDRGHEVEALTGFPNYPGGILYPGYRVYPWQRETLDGIRVHRTALFPSHDRSGLRRTLNYASFAAGAALAGPWLVRAPQVIYVYNLITLMPAARAIRRLRGGKIVLDVQDLWPESVAVSGMMRNRALLRLLDGWCRAEYRRAERLTVLSPGFKRRLAARGVSESRIDLIYNWCDEDAIAPGRTDEELAKRLGFAGRFNVVFAGTMGAAQSLGVVVEAARRLESRAPDILFTLVGGGTEVERLKKASAGLRNVQFLPRRPVSEIGAVLASADAMLVHLKNDPLFEITIPSKIQAYMHIGKPILCGVKGDAADVIHEANAGIAFQSDDPDALAEAVLSMRNLGPAQRRRMGTDGRAYYRANMAFSIGVRRLEQAFQRAVGAATEVPSFSLGEGRKARAA